VLPALRTDPIGFLSTAWRQHGDVVRLRLGGRPLGVVGHLLVHPDSAAHVLVERQRDYALSTGYDVLRSILGEGLLTSHGEAWRARRRLMQPAFRPDRLARVAPLVGAAAEAGADRLVDSARRDEPFELYGAMAAITFDAVGRAMFSLDVATAVPAVAPALRIAQEFALGAIYSPMRPVLGARVTALPTPAARRFRAAIAALDVVVADLVTRRRSAGGDSDDLLGLLLDADPADGGPFGTRAIRDEVLTFLLAGHETTASALTWTLTLLSRHPDVRADLQAEIDGCLGGRQPTVRDLDAMPLLDAVLSESLRLFPPAWMLERRAAVDDVIGGFAIPAGSTVILAPYLTHRHPDFWPNPEGFDPGRWGGAGASRPRTAYFPFGAGPRQCIGGAFAQLEAKLVLATLLQQVEIDLVPGERATPAPYVTLTAGRGVRVRARLR
jgi:cytochrome P450